jgi:hypothetical protein
MDPYLVFGMPKVAGLNARKSAVMTQLPLMKAYDVRRAAPRTVIVGNSRVQAGLEARDPEWPAADRPVYNLGLGAGSPYVSYRYLQLVMAQHHLSLVVLGLDFEYFMTMEESDRLVRQKFESHLSVSREGTPRADWAWQHARDVLQASVSLDAVVDSGATLAGNLTGQALTFTSGDLIWSNYAVGGTYPLVASVDMQTIRNWRGKSRNPLALADLRAILALCESRGTRLVVFMDPVHADELEILDALGYWQEFERWKRDVVALVAQYQGAAGRDRIQLRDFTGYDAYSSEALLPGRHVMRWYLEPRHYTKALGNQIVRRIVGGGDPNFGTLLEQANLERHLADIREQQRLYRAQHTLDVQRVRDLYDWQSREINRHAR